MNQNKVEWYKRQDGKWAWRIIAMGVKENIIATDGGQGYENEKDCLAGLFRLFFGAYDDSFLAAHARWSGESSEGKPEAYVRVDSRGAREMPTTEAEGTLSMNPAVVENGPSGGQ